MIFKTQNAATKKLDPWLYMLCKFRKNKFCYKAINLVDFDLQLWYNCQSVKVQSGSLAMLPAKVVGEIKPKAYKPLKPKIAMAVRMYACGQVSTQQA